MPVVGVLDAVRGWFSRARRPGPDEIMRPDPWDGWPAGWSTSWNPWAHGQENAGTVWSCMDRICSAVETMPLTATGPDRRAMARPPRWLTEPPGPGYTHIGEAIDEIIVSLHTGGGGRLGGGNAFLYVLARDAQDYPAYWMVLPTDRVGVSLDGLTYTISDPDGTAMRTIRMTGDPRVDDLLHIRYRKEPGDPWGFAPLDAVRAQVAALAGMQEISANLATKDGIPSGILSSDQVVNEDQARKYKTFWQQSVKAGEVAVVGNGFKYQSVQLSPADMALLELREVDGRMIASAFGVPPFMVGLAQAGDLTYSTVEGQLDYFWRSKLRALTTNIGRAMSRWVPRGSAIGFNAEDYVQPSIGEYVPVLAQAIDAGIVDAEEARELLNLPPGAPDPDDVDDTDDADDADAGTDGSDLPAGSLRELRIVGGLR